jgi:two-component system cell cycle response regulator DivK
MDIQLPDFDGWEALKQIRDDPRTAGLVVVAVTAYAVDGDEPRFLAGGFDGYLAKPIDVRSFSDTVMTFSKRGQTEEG